METSQRLFLGNTSILVAMFSKSTGADARIKTFKAKFGMMHIDAQNGDSQVWDEHKTSKGLIGILNLHPFQTKDRCIQLFL
jgi:hypothetical protein